MALWDLNRSAAGATPRRVGVLSSAHRTGIWAMHELGGKLVTASKDRTCCISSLHESRMSVVSRYEPGFGNLQTCRWRDESLFACAGGTPQVAVVDVRASGGGGAGVPGGQVLASGPAGTCVLTVRWSPRDEHLLLASGSDRAMRLHDMRAPATPLAELRGHVRKPNEKDRRIYAPSFTHAGAAVSAVGHGSSKLTVFSVDGGGTRVSEGQLLEDADEGGGRRKPLEAGCTLQAVGDGVLLLAHGTRLEAYVPQRVPPPAAAAAEDACA